MELHLAIRHVLPLNSWEFHAQKFTSPIDELQQLRAGDYSEWIEPLLTLDLWDQVRVIASERATCCVIRGVAGTYDLAYEHRGRRVLADLKTMGAHGRSYSTAAQLGGYMALEATHGIHYDAGHAIWAAPGKATLGRLCSRQECLESWAAAWTQWQAAQPC